MTKPISTSLLRCAVVLFALGLAACVPAAEPYSTLTFRIGATRAHTYSPLNAYYPGNSGVAAEVETPFEFGRLGVAVESITLKGSTPQQVTTSTKTFALDWLARASLSDRINVRGGMRIGDFHMLFHDPAFNLPGATPDHGTDVLLIGPTAAVDLRVFGPLQASLADAWIYMPTATRTRITYLTLLGSYTVGTPIWLKRFLQ